MRYSLFLFAFFLIYRVGSCPVITPKGKLLFKLSFDSTKGVVHRAWYEKSFRDTISPMKTLNSEFVIVVDPDLKATDFVSFTENYFRDQSNNLDTSLFRLLNVEGWNHLSVDEKAVKISNKMVSYRQQADSLHSKNNLGHCQVWIINNSPGKVSVQMQDASYICILQALAGSGQWHPIQTWSFSKCGNSYYDKTFESGTANSFVTTIPNSGDYETKLRFKLLGKYKFYYSNEFTGKINFSDFVDERASYPSGARPNFEYTLDSLIRLTR
ncbi:hypothetical protein V9K67_05895 [Paraflavisolibacter sp. H34]|uniref:hypothetical protein n=1 Tax=Huijunlia imazamoxiresistens TaxID=3127457 RepID=UPI003015AAF1